MKVTRRTTGLLLLLYTALIGVWTWRLAPAPVPQPPMETVDTQARVAAFLARGPKDTAMPALLRLVRLPEDQLQALSDWVEQPPLAQVRQLTVQKAPVASLGPEWGEALLQTLLAHNRPMDLIEAHLMIAASGDRLRDEARHEALETLARRAVAQGDAADATVILGRACELPSATWETVQHLCLACRSNRNPAPALHALTTWIKRHASHPEDPTLEQARDLELGLMLDADLTAEAVSLQLSHLTGKAPYPERALDRAYLAVRRAHQSSRLLAPLERHLQTFPEHALPPAQLAHKPSLNPDYLRWLSAYAAICDEEQPGSLAFAACLRLAAARVPTALPRLCALATTAAMTAEAEKALAIALDQADTQLTVLQLAQTDPIAKKVLTQKMRTAPHHRDLHYAATLAAAAAQPSGSTAILWQDFLRRFPEDVSGLRRLIQAHVQDRQPSLALRAYAALPARAVTEEDRQQQELLRQL